MFKAVLLYRVHEDTLLDMAALEDAAANHAAVPLHPSQAKRIGWDAPAGEGQGRLVHEIQGHRIMTALFQQKMLPPAVVKKEVESRAIRMEKSQGAPIGKRQRATLKEQVYSEFLPRAFVRTARVSLWWDIHRRRIGIDTTSRKRAEEALDLLRQTLGSLKVTPLATRSTPRAAMTRWLLEPDCRPAWLGLGDQTVLTSAEDSTFTARKADLDSDNVRQLLDSGHYVSRIALSMDSQAKMVLTDDLSLKGLKFDDALLDEASEAEDDSPVARFETEFSIMASSLSLITAQLIEALGGEAEVTFPSEASGNISTPQATEQAAVA